MTKQERLEAANELMKVIANCGRKFFRYKDFISSLELSSTDRVFFIDQYTKKRIYTHRYYCRWDGFTGGGTMKMMIESLRDFITKDSKMRKEYFQHDMGNGFCNPWGYGEDILKVKEAAVRFGIAV